MKNNDVVGFDVESTTFKKGAPFSKRNKLCSVALVSGDTSICLPIEYDEQPYGHALRQIRDILESAKTVVTFNGKFDIHWLRRYIPDLNIKKVWDVQLAEFVLSHQRLVMPSLDEVCEFYGFEKKLDVVKTQYWEQGFDTTDVPFEILSEYNIGDVERTLAIYYRQLERVTPKQKTLIELQCMDLLVLEEMEYNGMLFDSKEAERLANETEKKLEEARKELNDMIGVPDINWNSNNHVSAVLYGGIINVPAMVTKERTLKSGEVKQYQVQGFKQIQLAARVAPLPNTETKETRGKTDEYIRQENIRRSAERKPHLCRVFEVNEPVLQRLSKNKRVKGIIRLLFTISEQGKLLGTYYKGIPKLCEEMDWDQGILHGNFNQCVAVTGRLSSSEPNLQNFAGAIKPLFHSRYKE